jgi:hypothetical protein
VDGDANAKDRAHTKRRTAIYALAWPLFSLGGCGTERSLIQLPAGHYRKVDSRSIPSIKVLYGCPLP